MTTEEELYVCVEIFDYETPQERYDILSKPMSFQEVQQYIWDNYRDSGRQVWFMKYEHCVKERRLQN